METVKMYRAFALLWSFCLLLAVITAEKEGYANVYLTLCLLVVLATNIFTSVIFFLGAKRDSKK